MHRRRKLVLGDRRLLGACLNTHCTTIDFRAAHLIFLGPKLEENVLIVNEMLAVSVPDETLLGRNPTSLTEDAQQVGGLGSASLKVKVPKMSMWVPSP